MTGNFDTAWCGCVIADRGHRCYPHRPRNEPAHGNSSGDLPSDLADLPIGQRVAALRKLRGLTQAGLAARLHRSESWVRRPVMIVKDFGRYSGPNSSGS